MATDKDSRKRIAARNSTTRNRHASHARHPLTVPDHVRDQLRTLARNLSLARCAISISAQLLECQNADQDADVARLLRHDVGARLDTEIDKLDVLISEATPGST